jgi:hypothetical protein
LFSVEFNKRIRTYAGYFLQRTFVIRCLIHQLTFSFLAF